MMQKQGIQIWLVTLSTIALAAALAAKVLYGWPLAWVMWFFVPVLFLELMVLDLSVAVMVFCAYATFEGMLKLLSNSSPLYYIAHDAILCLIVIRWLRSPIHCNFRITNRLPASSLMMAFVGVCLLEFFNPYSIGLLASIAALRLHVIPMALYFVSYDLVKTRKDVRRFVNFFLILGVLASVFTIWQFRQGRASISHYSETYSRLADKYYWEDEAGNFQTRPFGVSSMGGGSGAFGQILLPFAICLFLCTRSMRRRILLALVVACLVTCVYVSVVRSTFLVTLGEFVLLLGCLWLVDRRRSAGQLIMLMGVLGFACGVLWSQHPDVALLARYQTAAHPVREFWSERGGSFAAAWFYVYSIPFGIGLGHVGGAGQFFKVTQALPVPVWSENYISAMILETGVPGLFLILSIIASLLRCGFRVYNHLRDRELRLIALGCWVSLVGIALAGLAGPMLVTVPYNVFFWFVSGMLLGLPDIEAGHAITGELAENVNNRLTLAHCGY